MSTLIQQPFFQVALPIIVTFIVATMSSNRRLDDIVERLKRIEAKLEEFGTRITRLEERTSLLHK